VTFHRRSEHMIFCRWWDMWLLVGGWDVCSVAGGRDYLSVAGGLGIWSVAESRTGDLAGGWGLCRRVGHVICCRRVGHVTCWRREVTCDLLQEGSNM
jgi:hypothetical protein